MNASTRYLIVRLLPVVLITIAAGAWFHDVQQGGPWVVRNLIPLAVLLLLSYLTLRRGQGHWSGSGLRMPFGASDDSPAIDEGEHSPLHAGESDGP